MTFFRSEQLSHNFSFIKNVFFFMDLFVTVVSLKMHKGYVHSEHKKDLTRYCVLRCDSNPPEVRKCSSHLVQLKGFSPVCFKMCNFSSCLLLYGTWNSYVALCHWESLVDSEVPDSSKSFCHIKGKQKIFGHCCESKRPTRAMPHFWHLCVFSPAWILKSSLQWTSCHRKYIHTVSLQCEF